MQLVVQIRPYYKKDLKSIYPRIADALSSIDKRDVYASLSLFDIVGKLDRILYEAEGIPPFRKIMLGYRDKLEKLHGEAQTLIADWKLAKVDQLLYQIEDIFEDIERELGEI